MFETLMILVRGFYEGARDGKADGSYDGSHRSLAPLCTEEKIL